MTELTSSDFCVVVYREDDVWEVGILPASLAEDLDGLIQALRQYPGIGGTIGLAAVGDDFFVALRMIGTDVSVFLSDLTAAVDWPLAGQVLDYLDIPVPEDEDLDQVLPAGDMSIFADLGVDEMELGALSGDLDLFPDEVLASIARRIGFGAALERALDAAMLGA
jgi:putative tRNA adenosine deaminase-associated protein